MRSESNWHKKGGSDTGSRPAKVKPMYVVKQEQPGADARTVQAAIDGFRAGGSKLG